MSKRIKECFLNTGSHLTKYVAILLMLASCNAGSFSEIADTNKGVGSECEVQRTEALCGSKKIRRDLCSIGQNLYKNMQEWAACTNWGRILSLEELVALRSCDFVARNKLVNPIRARIRQNYCILTGFGAFEMGEPFVIQSPKYSVVRFSKNRQWYIVRLRDVRDHDNILPAIDVCCNVALDPNPIFVLGDVPEQKILFPLELYASRGVEIVRNYCEINRFDINKELLVEESFLQHNVVTMKNNPRLEESNRMGQLWNTPDKPIISEKYPVRGLPSSGVAGTVVLESTNGQMLGFSLVLTAVNHWLEDPFIFFEGSPITATILLGVNKDYQLAAVTFATNITELVAWQPVFEEMPYPDELTLVPASIEPESPLPPLATLPLTSYTWYVSQCTLE